MGKQLVTGDGVLCELIDLDPEEFERPSVLWFDLAFFTGRNNLQQYSNCMLSV
jgi:hypothetical protein